MNSIVGQFPEYRPRRLRQSPALRKFVCETRLSAEQLVLPLFARPGKKLRREIAAMPGVFQLSPDELLREAARAHQLGVPAVLLFGIPDKKDARASGAFARNGIVQQAVRLLEKGTALAPRHHRRLPVRIHGARPLRHRFRRKNSQRPHA